MHAPRPLPGFPPRLNAIAVRASWVAHLSVLLVIPAALGWQTLLASERLSVVAAHALVGFPLLGVALLLVTSAAGRPIRWWRVLVHVVVMAAAFPAVFTYDVVYEHASPVFIIVLGYLGGIVLARLAQRGRRVWRELTEDLRADQAERRRAASGALTPLP